MSVTEATSGRSGRPAATAAPVAMTGGLTLLFATAVAVIVMNLFVAQPLIGLIGPALGLTDSQASWVATLTMLGYAAGLVLLVPLADLVETRALVLRTLAATVAALGAAAAAPNAGLFLAASFAVGVTSSVIQMLVPVAAFLAPEARRGRVVGNVSSGLLIGILLSRPLAGLVADQAGWRAMFALSALLVTAIGMLLARFVPGRRPPAGPGYAQLIGSLWSLMRTERLLRRRALYAALAMAAFSAFWTTVALRLSAPPFDLGIRAIALFGFAGAAGAVAAPLAGRWGDRGWTRPGTILAHVAMLAAMALAGVAGAGWGRFDPAAAPGLGIALLAVAAILLDSGGVVDQTLGRRLVNLIRPEARARLNGLFVGCFFVGGAVGSAVAGAAWSAGGWGAVCATGAVYPLLALGLDLSGRAGER